MIAFLAKIMPNIEDPSENRRKLIMSISNSRLLYGAPVPKYTTNRNTLLRSQITTVIRITRCYRTVSREAAQALAGMPPANLLTIEHSRIRKRCTNTPNILKLKIRDEERARTITIWSSLWRANRSLAPTTKTYLSNLKRWLERPPGTPFSFYRSQILTGHGCFRAYLHKIGKLSSPSWPYCGDPVDDTFHTFFNCHIREQLRAPDRATHYT